MHTIATDSTILRAPLVARLERLVDLTDGEREYLQHIQSDFTKVHDGNDIVSAGHTYRCFYILNRGMAIRYKVLHDGRRQILNLILPGDLIGYPGCLFDYSLYSIASLGEVIVCSVPHDDILTLFRRQPRLGAALFWLVGHEATMFAEHLVGVGRQTAYERVAHLLLELLVRLQAVGLADERSYCLPLTQEQMADTLGLSAPHVNRTLRRLRDDGLITLDGANLTCIDVATLSRLADFKGATLARRRIPGL